MQMTPAGKHPGMRSSFGFLARSALVLLFGMGVVSFGAASLGKLFSARSAVAVESAQVPVGFWSVSGPTLAASQGDSVALLNNWRYTGTDNGQGNNGQNNGNQNGKDGAKDKDDKDKDKDDKDKDKGDKDKDKDDDKDEDQDKNPKSPKEPKEPKEHGNNGVGNGVDPQPRGNPPVNDGPGTGPGNPGNQGGANKPS